jgi:lipopolysaccharide/colanic/teichoic acid biosynthesis glycosyltransferase
MLCAAISLGILTPFLIMIVLIIWIVERKRAFFFQNRVGRNKKEFKIYKFRTMANDEITPIGKVLRRTGIDELPQLLNILKGEMSFVGPRPLTKSDILRLNWDADFFDKRWSVRPGIVGLAQLAPVCHKKMSWFYDQLYLKKQNLYLDFKILAAAAIIPVVGKQTVKNWIHGKRKN